MSDELKAIAQERQEKKPCRVIDLDKYRAFKKIWYRAQSFSEEELTKLYAGMLPAEARLLDLQQPDRSVWQYGLDYCQKHGVL